MANQIVEFNIFDAWAELNDSENIGTRLEKVALDFVKKLFKRVYIGTCLSEDGELTIDISADGDQDLGSLFKTTTFHLDQLVREARNYLGEAERKALAALLKSLADTLSPTAEP